jgi:hypothetical protein
MATVVEFKALPEQRERMFFLTVAIIMALIMVGGFSFQLAMGRSSFAVPLIYHVHGLVFFGWIALYLLQNALVATGSVALHRKMGWLALGFIPVMTVLGIAMTLVSLRRHGGPPFFDMNEFLFGNSLGVLAFAGVALAGIAMRRRTDWHRRLLCGAMISLLGPGFGRLLPSPLLIPWAWWMSAVVAPGLFLMVVAAIDRRRIGRVHPAWFWGLGALVVSQLLADAIAYSPMGYAATRSVIAGTPAEGRSMAAFMPGPAPAP